MVTQTTGTLTKVVPWLGVPWLKWYPDYWYTTQLCQLQLCIYIYVHCIGDGPTHLLLNLISCDRVSPVLIMTCQTIYSALSSVILIHMHRIINYCRHTASNDRLIWRPDCWIARCVLLYVQSTGWVCAVICPEYWIKVCTVICPECWIGMCCYMSRVLDRCVLLYVQSTG